MTRSLRSAAGVVLLLLVMSLLSMRLVNAAKWNSWALQFLKHSLGSNHTPEPPASAPAGHTWATIWLAQDALAGGDPQRALSLVEAPALQNDPFALHIQAAALERQGNFSGAVQTYIRLKNYSWLIKVGLDALGANDLEASLVAYRAAWAIDPEKGASELANVLFSYGADPAGAEAVLRKALATYPTSSQREAWYGSLGDDLRKQKRFAEAEVVYQTALVEYPGDWLIYIGIGWNKYERGDGLQPAMDEFQKAINNLKSQGKGQLAIAQLLAREKRFEEADAWYARALAINPDQSVYWERGRNALNIGNLPLALGVYQESLAHFPNSSFTYLQLAYTYQMNGQLDQAKAAIEQALRLKLPPDPWYYTVAGSIYESAGDPGRALQAYRQVLQIDPNDATALEAVKRLEK